MSTATLPVEQNAPAQPGREALLRATVTVVAQGGLRALTYRAIAAEAGVSHSLVRYHFGSRDQLIAQALDYSIDQSLEASSMRQPSASYRDFAAGLETLARRQEDIHAFQYELLLESRRRPELQPHVDRYYETYRTAISTQLAHLGLHQAGLAETIWFALDGMVFQQLVAPGEIDSALHYLRQIIKSAAQLDA